jgi:cation-transporting ATPase 13A2
LVRIQRVHNDAFGLDVKFFEFQYQRFIMVEAAKCFLPSRYERFLFLSDSKIFEFRFLMNALSHNSLQKPRGLSNESVSFRKQLFGLNSLTLPKRTWYYLLAAEVSELVHQLFGYLFVMQVVSPLNFLELASVCVWFYDEYYVYAAVILLLCFYSLVSGLINSMSNDQEIRRIAASEQIVTVERSHQRVQIQSSELVPGDLIFMKCSDTTLISADALLLKGECFLEESCLTGESVPVLKSPFDCEERSERLEKHILNCGASLLKICSSALKENDEESAQAVVLRTGFETYRGNLIRNTALKRDGDTQFHFEAMTFLCFMGILGLFGCVVLIIFGDREEFRFTRLLDLLTIIIPPALPSTITIGIVHGVQMLRNRRISAMVPSR